MNPSFQSPDIESVSNDMAIDFPIIDMDKLYFQDDLREATVVDRWDEVIGMYEEFEDARLVVINSSRGTALHVAVNQGRERDVEQLVKAIIKHESADPHKVKALELKNENGDTPLHLAAIRGFKSICECIIGENEERKHLLKTSNNDGETPLFLAALGWQKQAFVYLSYVSQKLGQEYELQHLMRNNGDTILHCAIQREFLDLALIIMRLYPTLHDIPNKRGMTPLKVLATRPSAFTSGNKLSWWWQKITYHCIAVEDLDYKKALESYSHENDESANLHKEKFPENYYTCYEFISEIDKQVPILRVPSSTGPLENKPEKGEHNVKIPELPETSKAAEKNGHSIVPANYATCFEFVRSACKYPFAVCGVGITFIRNIKQKHRWGCQLLRKFMEKAHESYMGSGGQPLEDIDHVDETNPADVPKKQEEEKKETEEKKKEETEGNKKKGGDDAEEEDNDRKETAFLAAAKNGIVEMVTTILSIIPSALHDLTSDKKNAFHVAALFRQPAVFKALLKHINSQKEIDNWIQRVDVHENTVLHLAATEARRDEGWKIPGSALKMMWEAKWFEYIKQQVPEHFVFRNKKGETPWQIFQKSHESHVKDGSEWLKDTAESCSVVAALIAGVSFATASTVPGGNVEATGKPKLEGQPAFDAFAISSLIGLCSSVTALMMFLAILTSRKQAVDFRIWLPLVLLLGLSSLFVSIAAMFVSFCSGHFFLLSEQYKQISFPIYAVTSFPVVFYALAQLPLYCDLLQVICKKVPEASDRGY